MPNWLEILKSDVLEEVGAECTTTREMANKLGKKIKETVTVDSLFNAHKRHKDRLDLKDSLTDYMGRIDKVAEEEPKLDYIRFNLSPEQKEALLKAKRVVVTSAMNNCPVNLPFWESLKRYVKDTESVFVVVPSRYKNPSSPGETVKQQSEEFWPAYVQEYMTDDLVPLHEHLWLMANVRVGATAVNPLTGLETLSSGHSAIFGHSQVAMKMVSTPHHHVPKVLYSTGSCTTPIYSDTRAGVKGKHHHSYGALVVEKDGPRFYIRTLSADKDGGFYDLNKYYGPKKIETNNRVLALVTGDEHAMFNDSKNRAAVYTAENSICNTLKPEKIVRHDVFDGYSISHHNRKDPLIQYSKHLNGHHLVEDELKLTAKYIEDTTPKFSENIIVPSNHHDHLLRWMKEIKPLDEPWNIDAYIELWSELKNTVGFKESGIVHDDPLALWMRKRLKVPTKFLPRDSDYSIAGILVGFHGDQGSNGSRGSLNQYAKLGAKTVIGHSHTPGIKHGAFQVGTSSTLRMEYTEGPSSWAHCHCVIYPNGKRQLIMVIDGHWRLEDPAPKKKRK